MGEVEFFDDACYFGLIGGVGIQDDLHFGFLRDKLPVDYSAPSFDVDFVFNVNIGDAPGYFM